MHYLIAWIALPLLVLAASFGVGLLVEQVTRLRFPNGVVLPVGFAASFVSLALPYELGLGAPWGASLLVLLAVTGIVLARKRLAATLPDGPTALAAFAVYGLYIAPIVLSGQTSFAGYTLLGDTSVHFSMVDYISDHGARLVAQQPSSYSSVTGSELTIGYPLGLHFELASVRWLLGAEVAHIYQPFLAVTIALAVPPATQLLRGVGVTRVLSAAGAVVALAAYLPYSYALQGGLKELGMIMLVFLGGLLAWEVAKGSRPIAFAVVYGIVTAGAFEIYSYGGLPWFGLMGLAAIAGLLLRRRGELRAAAVTAAVALVAFAVAALPLIPDSVHFFSQGNRLLSSSTGTDVGNLIGPIRIWEAFGVWLVGDFRLPPEQPEWTYALVGLVAVLVLFGTLWSFRSRGSAPLMIALSALLVWIVLPAGLYIEAKLLTILSATIVLLALVGGWALAKSGRLPEGALLVLAVTIGIFASDSLAYHRLYLAPTSRLDELHTIDSRFKGQGPAMLNEFEEYGKHYLRHLPPVVPYDAWTPVSPSLRVPNLPVYARYYDLDVMTLPYVEQFPLLILRRSAVASRPPANYHLAFAGRYYEVWRRIGTPKVVSHLPLGGPNDAGAVPRCSTVRRFARTAPTGTGLLAAERAPAIALPVRLMQPFPRGWAILPDKRVAPTGQGRAGSSFVARGGQYRIWFRGSFGRGLKVYVDGRYAGRALSVQTPQQMAAVGEVTLTPGRHQLEIVRGGGGLAPGNGQDEAYDSVFLAPQGAPTLVNRPSAAASSLCGRHLDWIEVTSAPNGPPPSRPASASACPDVRAKPVDERVLIRPRPGTFYSVDVLNPDVVRRGDTYNLFFSGNSLHSEVGGWRTGLAVSRSPDGPFTVDAHVAAPFLNGGTIVQGGQFVQGYDRRGKRVPVFGRSRDGRRWRRFSSLPAGRPGQWNYYPSDVSLTPLRDGFRAYFAGRAGRGGADIGSVEYRSGGWVTSPKRELTRVGGTWDARDLGEPATFEAKGRTYMLYGGLRADGKPREIGIAVRANGAWQRCGDGPLIPAGDGWYSQNAIDPEPQVVGDRLYVYFGGGTRPSLGGDMDGTIGVRIYRLADLGIK